MIRITIYKYLGWVNKSELVLLVFFKRAPAYQACHNFSYQFVFCDSFLT